MKKIISLLIVLVLCMGLTIPAFASEGNFVPSITYKPNPEIVPVVGEDGEEYIGVIRNAAGEIVSYLGHGCLLITPIAHVWDEEIKVPKEVEDLLLFVYGALNDNSMTIPYEKHDAGLNADDMVIRDLFDVRWYCEEHAAMLEQEGYVLEINFELGIMADVKIFTMTYDEAANEWEPIVKTVNNGDGTVTCVFEHLCAVEFSMVLPGETAEAVAVEANESGNILPWAISLAVAALGAVGVVVFKKKKTTV